jgi:hypothetical protein
VILLQLSALLKRLSQNSFWLIADYQFFKSVVALFDEFSWILLRAASIYLPPKRVAFIFSLLSIIWFDGPVTSCRPIMTRNTYAVCVILALWRHVTVWLYSLTFFIQGFQ